MRPRANTSCTTHGLSHHSLQSRMPRWTKQSAVPRHHQFSHQGQFPRSSGATTRPLSLRILHELKIESAQDTSPGHLAQIFSDWKMCGLFLAQSSRCTSRVTPSCPRRTKSYFTSMPFLTAKFPSICFLLWTISGSSQQCESGNADLQVLTTMWQV